MFRILKCHNKNEEDNGLECDSGAINHVFKKCSSTHGNTDRKFNTSNNHSDQSSQIFQQLKGNNDT